MPAFIHTKSDESRWEKAKKAASKSTTHGTDSFWALSNYIYHRMGKSQESQQIAADMKKSFVKESRMDIKKSLFGLPNSELSVSQKLPKAPGSPSINMTSAMKMPKAKKMPDAMDKPSKFFKNETAGEPKHPSICKLKDFLNKKRKTSNLTEV
jgi:hypothetical protein